MNHQLMILIEIVCHREDLKSGDTTSCVLNAPRKPLMRSDTANTQPPKRPSVGMIPVADSTPSKPKPAATRPSLVNIDLPSRFHGALASCCILSHSSKVMSHPYFSPRSTTSPTTWKLPVRSDTGISRYQVVLPVNTFIIKKNSCVSP